MGARPPEAEGLGPTVPVRRLARLEGAARPPAPACTAVVGFAANINGGKGLAPIYSAGLGARFKPECFCAYSLLCGGERRSARAGAHYLNTWQWMALMCVFENVL